MIGIALSTASSCRADQEIATRVRVGSTPESHGYSEPFSDWDDIRLTALSVKNRITHPRFRDLMVFLALAGSSAYLERNKTELANGTQALRSPNRDRFSSAVRPLGEAVVPAAALSAYLIGRMTGSERTRHTGLILAESAAFTFATTELLQYVFAEQRPGDGGELRYLQGGGHGISGHTSIVASMAVPMDRLFFRLDRSDSGALRFGKVVGKVLVYGAPVATGWSRMNDDKHYAWNVVLGLGVGYLMGDFVMGAHEPDAGTPAARGRDWTIVPITGDRGGAGLAVRWSR
ncbi:MAG: phosphatase PAP2 family protein [Candidatus Polarisedimenticolia bacterium]